MKIPDYIMIPLTVVSCLELAYYATVAMRKGREMEEGQQHG